MQAGGMTRVARGRTLWLSWTRRVGLDEADVNRPGASTVKVSIKPGQLHVGVGQFFEETGNMLLVPADPVQSLGNNDIDPSGAYCIQKRHKARSLRGCAADGVL
jgi:hypothetical protein